MIASYVADGASPIPESESSAPAKADPAPPLSDDGDLAGERGAMLTASAVPPTPCARANHARDHACNCAA
jgi:hypothetical protein